MVQTRKKHKKGGAWRFWSPQQRVSLRQNRGKLLRNAQCRDILGKQKHINFLQLYLYDQTVQRIRRSTPTLLNLRETPIEVGNLDDDPFFRCIFGDDPLAAACIQSNTQGVSMESIFPITIQSEKEYLARLKSIVQHAIKGGKCYVTESLPIAAPRPPPQAPIAPLRPPLVAASAAPSVAPLTAASVAPLTAASVAPSVAASAAPLTTASAPPFAAAPSPEVGVTVLMSLLKDDESMNNAILFALINIIRVESGRDEISPHVKELLERMQSYVARMKDSRWRNLKQEKKIHIIKNTLALIYIIAGGMTADLESVYTSLLMDIVYITYTSKFRRQSEFNDVSRDMNYLFDIVLNSLQLVDPAYISHERYEDLSSLKVHYTRTARESKLGKNILAKLSVILDRKRIVNAEKKKRPGRK